jgi:hypothetical protein
MDNINTLNDLITHKINKTLPKFIDKSFEGKIHSVVREFFPKLNNEDIKILQALTTFIVDLISFKYHFDKTNEDYKEQWTQNNNRDIKGVILLLLPFIDDKENGYLLKSLQDLNHLLYNTEKDFNKSNSIPLSILELSRDDEEIKNKFKYGNMAIGLLKKSEKQSTILNLYNNNEKLIYTIIHNNFSGLLQTLDIMNGKLYINWININPLNLSNYKASQLFKQSKTALRNFRYNINTSNNQNNLNRIKIMNELENNSLTDYSGLWFGDIYNVFRNKYYEDAKKIKWLLFPYETIIFKKINDPTPPTKITTYLIQGLNKMLDINKIINNKYNSYEDIPEIDKDYFINKLDKLIKNLLFDKSIIGNIKIDIEILKYTLLYLFSNDKTIDINTEHYKKFKLEKINQEFKTDDFTIENTIQIKGIILNDIINALIYIKQKCPNALWNYLKKNVEQLELSAYGKFLILIDDKLNKTISETYYYWKSLGALTKYRQDRLNLKNIYNIAKSLSHTNITEWKPFSNNYMSLDPDDRYTFLCRINDLLDYDSWININKNIKRQYFDEDLSEQDIDAKTKDMLDAFKENYIYIIFEELVCSGILNKFTPNLHITNKTRLSQDTKSRQKELKKLMKKLFDENKENWEKSYYYLTNKKFKHLPKMKIDKINASSTDKYKEIDYFDVISEQHEWHISYAMDWISQISFFRHYIFHQIMYVTGSTGQGKSTQVPKLLLYALKCIDYKYNGKVICTEPRIQPTINNATRIAEELGVPIEETSNLSNIKIKTDNYYVQYKHQNNNHIMKYTNYNTLKIVTDGTLYNEMINSPTLKVTNNDKIKNTNIYDIIIVDEAHEHDTYMDLIIALGKQGCYINNQVRLIIVSATMDDDEPIYRRYFNKNKDMLLFPIKHNIFLPFSNKQYNVEYMDRRYHISPPGATTKYTIEEHYLDAELVVKNLNNTIDWKQTALKAQEEGYKKIIEICSKSTTGGILFFAIGEGEIGKAVEYLNNILPAGNIALPYYSKLNETYKNIISKIDIKISTIRNKRTNIVDEWKETFIEDITVPTGIYKRAIIVATNVAEASVTIPDLVYVIDNGFAKVNTYNSLLSTSDLVVEPISESSRIQRRGRVGRIGDGIIYYMYPKDARKNIKPQYKITQVNMELTMLKLLGMKSAESILTPYKKCYDKLIISDKINQFTSDDIIQSDEYKDYYTKKSGLYKIFQENFFINNQLIKNQLSEIKNSNDVSVEFIIFSDGQIFDNILDKKGLFYLIHPFEKCIKRNILNQIIKIYDNKLEKNEIPAIQFQKIIKNLYYKNLIIDPEYRLYNDKYEVIIYIPFVKTELGEYVSKITEKLEIEEVNKALTLLAACGMDCFKEVYDIIKCIEAIETLDDIRKTDITWKQFKEIYGNIKSDLIFIHELINKLKKEFSYLYLFKIDNTMHDILDQHYDNTIKKFMELSDKFIIPPSDYDVLLWNKLSQLKRAGLLSIEKKELLKTDISTFNIISSNIDKYKDKIKFWCDINYLNYKVIIQILKKLGTLYLQIDFSNDAILEWAKKLNSNFTKHLTNYTLHERIIRSFLYGNHDQFTFKFDMTSNTLYTIINSSKVIARIEQNNKKEQIILTNIYSSIIFYYKYKNSDLPNDTNVPIIDILFISEIKPEWLTPCSILLFNPANIFDITSMDALIKLNPVATENSLGKYQQLYARSADLSRLQAVQINSWKTNYTIWDSDKAPILQKFYSEIIKTVSRFVN